MLYHVTFDPLRFNGPWRLTEWSTIHTIRSLPLPQAQTVRDILNESDDAHALAITTIARRTLV